MPADFVRDEDAEVSDDPPIIRVDDMQAVHDALERFGERTKQS